ncbi:hypothetical protein [Mycobacterium sp. URHD0025]|uniref:hypothetical protein n=1 Tax=Mycobacterium sp. URHD0025 TaxID=1298864 RepID=UPI00056C8368|nr:hypothetical protein [Mycobacterium sp. URHD0025]
MRTDPAQPVDVEAFLDSGSALSPIRFSGRNINGVAAAESADVSRADPDPKPPEFCKVHMPYGTGDSCPGCKIAREHHERWIGRNPGRLPALARRSTADQRVAEIQALKRRGADCKLCQGSGWVETAENEVRRCDHPHESNEAS